MHEGQFNGVGDLFDLIIEAANVVVGDIGNFFQNEFFDAGARELFDDHCGSRIEQNRIAGFEHCSSERFTDLYDALFIGPAGDHGPVEADQFPNAGHLAGDFGASCHDDVQTVVQDDFLTWL